MVPADTKDTIRNKIVELAREIEREANPPKDDDVIPKLGILDSASIMSLVLWYEEEFDISTDDEELDLDNFGTINLMVDYLARNQRR
jgi:acyl carrier protein